MQIIKEYVAEQKQKIRDYITSLETKPKLVILQVGDVEASNRYVKNKLKDCAEVDLPAELIHFEEAITEADLLAKIYELNEDESVTGFICQLPLPKHIRETAIINAIKPEKDVDGFSKLALVNPATPQGIINYLEANNYNFVDKNAVVIGRSNIVGRPMARLLLDRSCNVRVIHSKTSEKNKIEAIKNADLIISATGHRKTLVNSDTEWTNLDCFIVDVGINFTEEGKLVGDCEDITLRDKTPVPGGCGLLTRLALITNLLQLYKQK